MDIHYNSLPRQAFPTSLSTMSSPSSVASTPSSVQHQTPQQSNVSNTSNNNNVNNNNNSNNTTDTNANPSTKQRNVAFGKIFFERPNLTTTAITTTHFPQSSVLSSTPTLNFYQLNGSQKQRGFSVPNLGLLLEFIFFCFFI